MQVTTLNTADKTVKEKQHKLWLPSYLKKKKQKKLEQDTNS